MTQLRFKVKKDDLVEVITGKNKGKRGKVLKVFLSEARVLVEGVNVVTRFLKATPQNPDGPVSKTLPIHISNVAVVDPSTDKPGKVAIRINEDGTKTRVFKKSAQAV
jgi:large subunit ribosomal protein L24